MTKHRWNYNGDINLRHGGYFWREDDADNYVLAVDVIPLSDVGGADNQFWIEEGSIYLPPELTRRRNALSIYLPPKLTRRRNALSTCGYTMADDGSITDCMGAVHKRGTKTHRSLLVDAFKAYHGIEADYVRTTVQIGPDDPYFDKKLEPVDVRLRANAKLRNYVRREHLCR